MVTSVSIGALALLLGASMSPSEAAPPQMSLPPQPAVRPAGIPADAVMVSPCIATMGEHWATLKNLPMGPIYGVWHGKPVFTEIMVTVDQLKAGFSYANIRALPGYAIDHIDVGFEPNGHEGLPVPHYDVHAYYVSPEVQATICPSGIPDPAMKPMNPLSPP
ncbi:MAG: hypothetical protein JO311_05935 [Candidatus Eremiobacteraeota bacterium]|nr:hypothetical protein [Candidatus Eremiobacteraeota bacterium]MBV9263624.1 hypothetical protein [Candidatus Eremiobacteraeota bacterium]